MKALGIKPEEQCNRCIKEDVRELWVKTVIAYSKSDSDKKIEDCMYWADGIVEEYVKRFNENKL